LKPCGNYWVIPSNSLTRKVPGFGFCDPERMKGDKFTGVPKVVWEFYIGGYQVCHKWLKDRKGRTPTSEDIAHYQRIVIALQETICLMQQIDEAIPGFPIE